MGECTRACVVSMSHGRACLMLSCPPAYRAPGRAILGDSLSGTSLGLRIQHCSTVCRPAARLPAGSSLGQRLRKSPDAYENCAVFNPLCSSWGFDKPYICSFGHTSNGCLVSRGVLLPKRKVTSWYRTCFFKTHLHPTVGASGRQLLSWPGAVWYPGAWFP